MSDIFAAVLSLSGAALLVAWPQERGRSPETVAAIPPHVPVEVSVLADVRPASDGSGRPGPGPSAAWGQAETGLARYGAGISETRPLVPQGVAFHF